MSFLPFFLLFVPSFCLHFWLNVHSTEKCDEDSIVIQWTIPVPSDCTKLYDLTDKWVVFSVNDDEYDFVNITFFEEKDYCESDLNPSNLTTIPTNECVTWETSDGYYYVNFTITEDPLPTNIIDGSTLGYFIFLTFQDNQCKNSYQSPAKNDIVVRTNNPDVPTNLHPLYFCTNEHFVYVNEHYEGYVEGEMVLLPRSKSDICITTNGINFPFSELSPKSIKCSDIPVVSFILQCLTPEKAEEEYINPIVPEKSITPYIMETLYYTNICSFNGYISSPYATDVCLGNWRMTRANEHALVELLFTTTDCSDDPYAYYIYKDDTSSLFDDCNYVCPLMKTQKSYSKSEQVEDPFIPEYISLFVIPTEFVKEEVGEEGDCLDFDLTVHIENPELYITYYAEEEFCFFGSWLGWTGGFKGFCNQGKLHIRRFFNYSDCAGPYEEIDYSEQGNKICMFEPKFVSFFTCAPRMCGNYNENDEMVCNGKGTCIQKDLCSCDLGYSGDLCQEIQCFGILHIDDDDVEEENNKKECNGNGECVAPDICSCFSGFSGEQCGKNDLQTIGIIFAITSSSFFLVFFIFVFFCCLSFCCLFFFIFLFCSLVILSIVFINLKQKLKIERFKRLEDFEILLKEQLLGKDKSIAHLKINKTLFEVDYDEINILELIGQGGSNASIYKVLWHEHLVAFKCFKTRNICSSQENLDEFERELNILSNLIHPYIVRFFGACMKPPRIGILMGYCENGEILAFLSRQRIENINPELQSTKPRSLKSGAEGYPIDEKLRMIREIVQGMEFIHSRDIVHRDLKAENVLVDSLETCKILDFGISRFLKKSRQKQTKKIGTGIYMAPEMLTGKYNQKVDVFSFSILLWIMLSEDPNPYGDEAWKIQIEFKVSCDPNFRPDLDKIDFKGLRILWLKEVIKICWSHDHKKRHSFSRLREILQKNMGVGSSSNNLVVSSVKSTTVISDYLNDDDEVREKDYTLVSLMDEEEGEKTN